MNTFIYCRFNLFDLHQRIHLMTETGEAKTIAITTYEELSEVIPEMCKKYGITKVNLFGPEQFTEEMVEQIHTNGINNYGINNLEIEVMK